ncbi:bile acid:sodium symporter family protein [Paenibacillus gansuensis]|uniref:Bile acid:sodium symporter family protein n=1 Tax=Paenibacillus gansuensis TaxID=306542 RepID=A0ABW5PF07_9BACL
MSTDAMKRIPFGLRFNAWFERYMFIVIPGALTAGFWLADELQPFIAWVPWLFAFITLVMGWGCSAGQIAKELRRPLPMLLLFALAHIAAPLIAYAMGAALFGAASPYVVGMVLFTVIPLGVSSAIWVGLSGGSTAWILAMIVIDSLLSPAVVPASVHLFFGADIHIDSAGMMLKLLAIIVIPTAAGVALYELSRGRIKAAAAPVAAPVSKLCFTAVVMINAAAIAPHVTALRHDMAVVLPAVLALVAVCYLLGLLGSMLLRRRDPAAAANLTYASGMRNISLGMVIGLAYFGPLAAVPVVLAILIQQPMATLNYWILRSVEARRLRGRSGNVPHWKA